MGLFTQKTFLKLGAPFNCTKFFILRQLIAGAFNGLCRSNLGGIARVFKSNFFDSINVFFKIFPPLWHITLKLLKISFYVLTVYLVQCSNMDTAFKQIIRNHTEIASLDSSN